MNEKTIPTPEELRNIFRYDRAAGKLYRLRRPIAGFRAGRLGQEVNARRWNTRFEGKMVDNVNDCGYIGVTVNYKPLLVHRIIWAMHYGKWPENEIDHINHDRSDNRIVNLREVTRTQNGRNQSMFTNNTSGYTGVIFRKRTNKWRAQIKVGGVKTHLGYFNCITAAAIARKKAEIKYGFHINHGSPLMRT